ncbi:hypothetical protein BJ742DRAFT_745733 [Cladochytrium replicatum]|nr:hypothetical protein BJ742DRAFT_745733 [Cladochytrium replicatum]
MERTLFVATRESDPLCTTRRLVFLISVILALTSSAYSLTIEPSLNLYSKSDKFLVGREVVFDAGLTQLDRTLQDATYYFLFQFGERNIIGEPQFVIVPSATPPRVNFTYTTPGIKQANLTVSDTPFTYFGTPTPFGITSEGKAAPMRMTTFEVLKADACFDFDLFVDWNGGKVDTGDIIPYSGDSVRFYLTVVDNAHETNVLSTEVLTHSFENLGESPIIVLSNRTNEYTINMAIGPRNEPSHWVAEIDGSIFESGVPTIAAIYSSGTYLSTCGIAQTVVDSVYSDNSLYISTLPDSLQIAEDHCFRKQGAIAAFSSDGFDNQILLQNLKLDASGTQSGPSSVCKGLSVEECSKLSIFQAIIVNFNVAPLYTPRRQEGTLTKVNQTVLEAANQFEFILNIEPISFLGPEYSVVSVVYDYVKGTHLALVGKSLGAPSNICSLGTSPCAVIGAKIIAFSAKSAEVYFSFLPAAVLTGLSFHANAFDLFAYGDSLWQSSNGGSSFVELFSIVQPTSFISEVFIVFKSTNEQKGYGLQTNLGKSCFGRAGTLDLVVVNKDEGNQQTRESIYFDELGAMYRIVLDIFKVKESGQASIRRIPVPVTSLLTVADFSFPSSLIPIPLSNDKLLLRTYPESVNRFYAQYLSYIISQTSQGSSGGCSVTDILYNGLVAECLTVAPFVQETKDNSPALNYGLTVDGVVTYSVISNPQKLNANMEPVTFTLSSQDTSVVIQIGWLLTDIGKSITVNLGSFIVTGILNSTTATGLSVRGPVSKINNLASGLWKIYDLRSYKEDAKTLSQTVTITNYGINLFRVTVDAGYVTFKSDFLGMIFGNDPFAGQIVQVIDSNNIIVAKTTDLFPVGISGAENWKLFGITDFNVSSPYPQIDSRAEVQTDPTNLLAAANPPQLKVVIYNPALYNYSISGELDVQTGDSSVNILLKDIGKEGTSIITWKPNVLSILCPSSAKPIRVINGCPPSRYMANTESPLGLLVQIMPYLIGSIELIQSLPHQINPVFGIDMQYHSKLDNTNNVWGLKHKVGAIVQMKTERLHQFQSQTVRRVLSEKKFMPQFTIYQSGFDPSALTNRYSLIELNNRTDYCPSSVANCKDPAQIAKAIMNPLTDTIEWEGPELYHFRAQVIEGEYCLLTTEFVVYVVVNPPRTTIVVGVMSLAAVVIFIWFFVTYLAYSFA